MHQNRGEGDGGDAHQTHGHTHLLHGHSGHVSRPSTGYCPHGHHLKYVDGGGRRTLRRRRAGGDGLSDPPELYPAFWSSQRGVADDISRLRGVDMECAAPLGRLLSAYERPSDRTGKADRVQAIRGRRNLSAPHGEVCPDGDGAGFLGLLWNGAAGCRSRSGPLGWYPCYAPPMVTTLPKGGLGVPHH